MKNMRNLQSKLKSELLKSNLSIREVERRAGLNRSALSNILQGKSKNPTLHTLYGLAEVLGCSLSDFIDSEKPQETTENFAFKEQISFPTLVPVLHQAIDVVEKYFKAIEFEPNLEQFLASAKNVYINALENKNNEIDPLFAEWLIDKFKE